MTHFALWKDATIDDPSKTYIANCYRSGPSGNCPPPPDYSYNCADADGSFTIPVVTYQNVPVCHDPEAQVCMSGQDPYYRCLRGSDIPSKNLKKCGLGNPIDDTSGNKFQVERDYVSSTLKFTRTYNSLTAAGVGFERFRSGMGAHWRHTYSRSVVAIGNESPSRYVEVFRPDGRSLQFARGLDGSWYADRDVKLRLSGMTSAGGNLTGYRVWDPDERQVETYDALGKLLEVVDSTGQRVAAQYNAAGEMISVADSFGRSLTFGYTNGLLTSVTTPSGKVFQYEYDPTSAPAIVRVVYPTGFRKQYHYNEAGLAPSIGKLLTGVSEERVAGVFSRLSSYTYNDRGIATSTQLTGGVNKFEVDPNLKRVLDPLGKLSQRNYVSIAGVTYMTSQSQPEGAGCQAAVSKAEYDTNGNRTSLEDFKGYRSCFAYDTASNRETVRVEGMSQWDAPCASVVQALAVLPVNAIKVTRSWHPDWGLETRIAEPRKLTTLVYNGQPDPFSAGARASCAPSTALLPDGKPIAVLCKRVEQATTDKYGATGFSATVESATPTREWTWTYDAVGRVLTERGPRPEAGTVATYAYHSSVTPDYGPGDLKSITNALGQTVTYSRYTRDGLLLQSADANGVPSIFTYDDMGRMLTQTIAGEKLVNQYQPNGLLSRLTRPDLTYQDYSYDDAGRLVGVTDSRGYRTEYALDNAGNRLSEVTKDSAGNVVKAVTQVYDVLGRIQQRTGRE